jgi:hypothetical protein
MTAEKAMRSTRRCFAKMLSACLLLLLLLLLLRHTVWLCREVTGLATYIRF